MPRRYGPAQVKVHAIEGPGAGEGVLPVRFRLLGPVRAESTAGPVDIGGPTARAVLAVLLLRGDAGASTDEIIAAVWGTGGATRDSAYHYVSALRKAVRAVGASLETHKPRYRLAVDADAVDWHRFRRLAHTARGARDRRELDLAAALLRDSLALWAGPPLADIVGRLDAYRRNMSGHRRTVIEMLAEVETQRCRPDEVLALLQGELATVPLSERVTTLMIDALTALGRRDEAGEVYRAARARLTSELGLDPSPGLEAAHSRALSGRVPAGMATVLAQAHPGPISGLPRQDPNFTGRSEELRTVTGCLGPDGGHVVCVICGMAGVGKTALAVRAAHELADAFPSGIIFVDLHGYTEGRDPLTAAEALGRLLRRMRVDGAAIPVDLDERAALYSELLANQQMLLVLDNARDATQVASLLPGADGCRVIVTSRRKLAALDDAVTLPLGPLGRDEAVDLFQSITAHRLRGPAAGQAVVRVADLCGRLPLAIRIAAGRYRADDGLPLARLAEILSVEDERLSELDDEDRSVAASFRVSLHNLPSALARMFALLATFPGADFDPLAVAALADLPPGLAARQLRRLADRHLITENSRGRYLFHDLVRVFARQHAVVSLSAADAPAALRRLAHYLLHAAETADSLITPHRYRIVLEEPVSQLALPTLKDYDSALAWLSDEQGNLADVCLAAGEAGLDVACWQLAYTLRGYYFLTKNWQSWMATHEAGLAAARRLRDARAEAMIANNLGLALLEQGEDGLALHHYERARRLFATVPDPHGENTARANLAWLLFNQRRYAEFLAEMRPVLDFYTETGSERNAAITLRGIGLAEAEAGLTGESVADLRRALDIFTRLGLHLDIAMTWNALGEAYQRVGEHEAAAAALAQALAAAGHCGSGYEQARAHHRLGQIAAAAGNLAGARDHWAQAAAGYRALGAREAADVEHALRDLPGIADFQVDSHIAG
jgi:DNA-binding SARP family transcriptional activator/tetratricopeptide (TPR) repeat protein